MTNDVAFDHETTTLAPHSVDLEVSVALVLPIARRSLYARDPLGFCRLWWPGDPIGDDLASETARGNATQE